METRLFVFLASVLNCIMVNFPPFAILKFKNKFNKYYAMAIIICIDILLAFPKTIGTAGANPVTSIITCSFPVVWCILLFQDALWKKIVVPIGFTIFIVFPLEFISMFFMNVFWGGNAFENIKAQNDIYLAGLILNNILYYVIMIFAILLWKRFVDKKRTVLIHVYWIVALYQTVLFVFWIRLAKNFTTMVMWIGLLLAAFGIVLDGVLFFFFNQMEAGLETEEKLAALYKQRDFEKEYYQTSQKYLEQMKRMQDAFLAHIRELRGVIKRPDFRREMEQFVSNLEMDLDFGKQVVYSSNPIINALLSIKSEYAAKQNTIMEIHCVHGQNIGIEDIDICSVLGNLLDNAIEACGEIEPDKRKITVMIGEKAGFMVIKITNPLDCTRSKNIKIGYTSKPDMDNHGLGLRMVERICEKYEGKLSFVREQNNIRVSAILKQKSK